MQKTKILSLIDEGWINKGIGVLQANGRVCYLIDMGKVIGTNGETILKIVTDGYTNELVTAFPVP